MKIKICLLASLFALTGIAFSDLVVSNLGETNDGADSVFDDQSVDPYLGNTFTTGSATNYQIDAVTFNFGTHGVTDGEFYLYLYSDSANAPGVRLATFTGPTGPAASTNLQYTLSPGYAVDANTTYWLVAAATNGPSNYGWAYSNSGNETSSVGWTIGTAANIDENFGVVTAYPEAQRFSIEASAIPEPAVIGLLLSFGGGLLGTKRIFSGAITIIKKRKT